jgi:hypothetical protein
LGTKLTNGAQINTYADDPLRASWSTCEANLAFGGYIYTDNSNIGCVVVDSIL